MTEEERILDDLLDEVVSRTRECEHVIEISDQVSVERAGYLLAQADERLLLARNKVKTFCRLLRYQPDK